MMDKEKLTKLIEESGELLDTGIPYIKEVHPGLFEINTGSGLMWTGIGGVKQFTEALEKEVERLGEDDADKDPL